MRENDLSMKPIVFAAILNKSCQSYEQVLRSLVSYVESLNVKLKPKSALIDFEQVKLFKDEQAQQQLANLLSLPLMPPEEVTGSYCHIVKDSVIWIINYLSEQIMILRNHTECEISYRKLESF
ncbi:unnamed protein product [Didymodactylos carnosus]|uniref:Uncharacterized protein n=1 Tax=Didymodactylos carnosus TaxID=1234261 RepID=A0A815YHG2_9BILA|nr:unnamed protein product [Didymodactylos carnosus]CAF4433282.1 unnamed protein product [Didymodactylos carnosus]